jgi:hypothetical protein
VALEVLRYEQRVDSNTFTRDEALHAVLWKAQKLQIFIDESARMGLRRDDD